MTLPPGWSCAEGTIQFGPTDTKNCMILTGPSGGTYYLTDDGYFCITPIWPTTQNLSDLAGVGNTGPAIQVGGDMIFGDHIYFGTNIARNGDNGQQPLVVGRRWPGCSHESTIVAAGYQPYNVDGQGSAILQLRPDFSNDGTQNGAAQGDFDVCAYGSGSGGNSRATFTRGLSNGSTPLVERRGANGRIDQPISADAGRSSYQNLSGEYFIDLVQRGVGAGWTTVLTLQPSTTQFDFMGMVEVSCMTNTAGRGAGMFGDKWQVQIIGGNLNTTNSGAGLGRGPGGQFGPDMGASANFRIIPNGAGGFALQFGSSDLGSALDSGYARIKFDLPWSGSGMRWQIE